MNEEYSFMVDKDGNFYRVEYVPVVRCKDCKYGYKMTDSAYVTCGRMFHDGQKHEPDWYCADGVKRDD